MSAQFAANPPAVHDWHVPVALIDFKKLKDANWDITASKVCVDVLLSLVKPNLYGGS